jgi:putative transposon-encoded protein
MMILLYNLYSKRLADIRYDFLEYPNICRLDTGRWQKLKASLVGNIPVETYQAGQKNMTIANLVASCCSPELLIATITMIESVVTPSGNSGHVVLPKAWIGKEAIVTLKEEGSKSKGR